MAYVALIILGFIFVYSAIGAFNKSRLADDKMNTAKSELENLEEQKLRLTSELENANTPYGQEKALREKFNVVKEGEQVIVIVNKEDSATTTPSGEKPGWFGKKSSE
jgi:cell division protein FtsB